MVEAAPGVSIMKPLMGVDDNLRDNLETFFTIDYPQYEIIFCIQDPNDPAILVVRHLMEQYPNVDTRLFYGTSNSVMSPTHQFSNIPIPKVVSRSALIRK